MRSSATYMILKARQGNATMHLFPFADLGRSEVSGTGRRKPGGAARAIAYTGKTCPMCKAAERPAVGYDLFHVLFECPATVHLPQVAAVVARCRAFVSQIADCLEAAWQHNAAVWANNAQQAGASLAAAQAAIVQVRALLPGYDWGWLPGQWLTYLVLLALTFPAKVVKPDADPARRIWRKRVTRRKRDSNSGGAAGHSDSSGSDADGEADQPAVPQRTRQPQLHVQPVTVDESIPEACFSLPEAVGRLYDATILPPDALRPLADTWCRLSVKCLSELGAVIAPLRAAADAQIAAEQQVAAAAAGVAEAPNARAAPGRRAAARRGGSRGGATRRATAPTEPPAPMSSSDDAPTSVSASASASDGDKSQLSMDSEELMDGFRKRRRLGKAAAARRKRKPARGTVPRRNVQRGRST